jgi:polysaccharide export outer membrane protein
MRRLCKTAREARVACTVATILLVGFASPGQAQQVPDYTMNAGDTLDVSVWKEEDLTKKDVIVRPDGKFSFPLAGQVVARGRTVAEIEADITARLKRYVAEPVVSVAVKNLDGCRIYVIGQVTKAGSFVMNPRINVLQALSLAGGMTPFAAVNDIMVLRGSGESQRSIAFHYGDVIKGRNLSQNVLLEPGDVVVVP